MSKEYRIKETIGPYWNRRYDVQEKYTYWDNGKEHIGWHSVFHSPDRKMCEEVLARRQSQ